MDKLVYNFFEPLKEISLPNFMISGVWILFVLFTVVGLFFLIRYILQLYQCKESQGNVYEAFQACTPLPKPPKPSPKPEYNVYEIKKRIDQIRSLKNQVTMDQVDQVLQTLNDSTNRVCAIKNRIQNIYIANVSATNTDPKHAKKQYIQEQSLYETVKNGKVLECFVPCTSDIGLYEQQLNDEVVALEAIVYSPAFQDILDRSRRIETTIGFNNTFLNKGLRAISAPVEGFATGPELLVRADTAIDTAYKLLDFQDIPHMLEKQESAVVALENKMNMFTSGNITTMDVLRGDQEI